MADTPEINIPATIDHHEARLAAAEKTIADMSTALSALTDAVSKISGDIDKRLMSMATNIDERMLAVEHAESAGMSPEQVAHVNSVMDKYFPYDKPT